MGSTLRRYVLGEVRKAFLAGLAMAVCVLFVLRIMGFVDLVFARGVPGDQVLALAGYIVPSFLEIALPMAMLLSVVVGIGRLQSDGEVTAMSAAGLSLTQLARPVFRISFVVALASLALGMYVRPWANRNIERTSYDMARTRLTANLRPGVFNSWFGGVIIYIDQLDPDTGLMKHVVLSDERDEQGPRTLFAREGRVVSHEDRQEAYLSMRDGALLSYHDNTDYYDRTDFTSFELYLELREEAESQRPADHEPTAMSWPALLESREALVTAGKPAIEETIEIQRKLVLPVATCLLPLIGVPLAISRTRTARSRGLVVSISVILVYYLLLTGAVTVAREQRMDAVVAMWLPNVALVVASAYVFIRRAGGRSTFPAGRALLDTLRHRRKQKAKPS
jgi:lipopolysaccharide export system permease protein